MKLVDLHCHILPCMDDGAKDIDSSLELLRAQAEQGVSEIVFTPHFEIRRETVDAFVLRREKAYAKLMNTGEPERLNICCKLGAEVYYSSKLADVDLKPLCIADTPYLLIEFPMSQCPLGIDETLYHIQQNGYLPIIAHPERYTYVRKDVKWLYDLVYSGNLVQINAEAFLQDTKTRRFVSKLLQNNLAHFISTDTHSISKRPPRLEAAIRMVTKECGEALALRLSQDASNIFNGKQLDMYEPEMLQKFLWTWK